MGGDGFEMVNEGKFSIKERNRQLGKIYMDSLELNNKFESQKKIN